ncbi:hypothetical protein CBS101457_003420 [Exobasidium rhododendri]|nr:hypothetical protein CBS101457_003420 [Exobasidium rhododendri]
MAETGLPLGAVYSGATKLQMDDARKLAETQADGYIPTAFNPATCSRKGYCRVAKDRVPIGGNREPSPDAITKGAKKPYSDPCDDKKGFNVYYEVHGTGDIHIVFIMGLNNSCFGWLHQVEYFAKDSRYSCVVLDNRGYGNSEIPSGSYSTSEMALDVLDLLDYLEWTQARSVNVVGISMGGMISLELAKVIPERISSLTLISTTSGRGRGEKPYSWKGVSSMGRMIGGRTLGFDSDEYRVNAVMELLFPPAFLDKKHEEDPKGRLNRQIMKEMFAFRYSFSRRQTVYGALAQLRAVFTHQVKPADLKQIDEAIPKTIIITGDEDNLVNPGNSKHLAKHMPRAELQVLVGSGHAPTAQLPRVVNALLDRTIKEGREELSNGKW